MQLDTNQRVDMLGAALDLLDDGVAILDIGSAVVYWNDAAAALTGYARMHLLSRPCPEDLYLPDQHHPRSGLQPGEDLAEPVDRYTGPAYSGQMYVQRSISLAETDETAVDSSKPALVEIRHQRGHTFPAMLRRVALRDPMGRRIGTALLFHPAEDVDSLPHGETFEGVGVARSQTELEDRLEAAFHEWKMNQVPFGLLWITVDQAAQMRRTHGRDACEAMLSIFEQRLAQGLRPTEIIGRWGDDEFLVLSHERTSQMLVEHGKHLIGLARTAEFRWWGDRVSLTASIGAAQAIEGDTLSRLMLEAQQSMHASLHAGGNHVTHAKGQTCSQ